MAGKLTVNPVQINDSVTATNNFVLKADNLGGLKLSRGNDGATTDDIWTVDSDGNFKQTSTVASMVRLNTANGYGSTNTKIFRFSKTITNQGSDITYADSATLGASFTINANGVYAVAFTFAPVSSSWFGISLNSSQLTTDINSITDTDVISQVYGTTTGASVLAANTMYFPSGSVIRPHGLAIAVGAGAPQITTFTITRVS